MQLPRFPVTGIPAQQRIDKLRGQLELAVTDGEAGAGPQQIPILGVQVHAAAQYLQGLLRCARLQRHGQYIAGAGVLRLQLNVLMGEFDLRYGFDTCLYDRCFK